MNLYGSICLSDIPQELIETGSNGKKYLPINIDEKREADQWGNTHYVRIYQKQTGGGRQVEQIYLGNLKTAKTTQEKIAEAEKLIAELKAQQAQEEQGAPAPEAPAPAPTPRYTQGYATPEAPIDKLPF